ncbi:hypothetical protein ACJ41O_012705 [Fusarium nematophilum]
MCSFSTSTWNSLGLGVAASWAALGLIAVFDPHRTASLFGVTITGHDSKVGLSGLIGSRDLVIGLILFLLGRKGRNDAMGTLILSTLGISATDIYLVWRRRSYVELAVLVGGSGFWAFVGLGLCGFFD